MKTIPAPHRIAGIVIPRCLTPTWIHVLQVLRVLGLLALFILLVPHTRGWMRTLQWCLQQETLRVGSNLSLLSSRSAAVDGPL